MPRATTKTELIDSANAQWDKLWGLVDTLNDPQAVVFNFQDDPRLKEAHWRRDKNLRDIFVHLYEWHQLLLSWTSANFSGETKSFLPEPYTWKNYGDMNVKLWEKHQTTPYDEAVIMLRSSHAKVMELIEALTDEELFEKKHYRWTGTTNIGSYCISASASHYDWATKKIKQYLKTKK